MKKIQLPSQKRLKELFTYNKSTGKLYYKISTKHSINVGDIAGCLGSHNYLQIKINRKSYLVHRIIWKLIHNEEPNIIDHIDGNKLNNRIKNLRSVTQTANLCNRNKPKKNSKSGYIGVSWHIRANRWQANINVNSKDTHLGLFDTAEEASVVYQEAKAKRDAEIF